MTVLLPRLAIGQLFVRQRSKTKPCVTNSDCLPIIHHHFGGHRPITTVELKTNFLGTAREGVLTCSARAAHLGNTTQVWDAVVSRAADSREIALFRCTQMILWPQSA